MDGLVREKMQSSGGKSCREAFCRYVVCWSTPCSPYLRWKAGIKHRGCPGRSMQGLIFVQMPYWGCSPRTRSSFETVQAPGPGSHFYYVQN